MTRTARCLTLANVLVQDLSAGGYEIADDGIKVGGRTWTRNTVRSPNVDGVHEVSKTLDGNKVEITVRCTASTWVGVETLYLALLAVVEVDLWHLQVELDGVSYTYLANAADTATGISSQDLRYKVRTVVLSIPVQPTPAYTGI